MNIEPVEFNDLETLNRICRFRVRVWLSAGMQREDFLSGDLKDEHEEHARHWIVRDGERLLASARMCVHKSLANVPNANVYENLGLELLGPFGSINRLVIDPQARGLGLSKQLDKARLRAAVNAECKSIVAWWTPISGNLRLRVLERHGFQRVATPSPRSAPPFGEVVVLFLPLGGQSFS